MRTVTIALLWAVPILLGLYDLFARFGPRCWGCGVEATISRVLYRWTEHDPRLAVLAALVIGALAGHLLLPQYVYPPR